ncbi:MAG: hypothetical protein AAF501_06560 [Pseudomonadota bacterium]
MIIWDMTLLAIETLLSVWGLVFTACMIALFGMLWSIWGGMWVLRVMTVLLFGTLVFILGQAGSSAWGSSLMLYLMPASISIIVSAVAAIGMGSAGIIRKLR